MGVRKDVDDEGAVFENIHRRITTCNFTDGCDKILYGNQIVPRRPIRGQHLPSCVDHYCILHSHPILHNERKRLHLPIRKLPSHTFKRAFGESDVDIQAVELHPGRKRCHARRFQSFASEMDPG